MNDGRLFSWLKTLTTTAGLVCLLFLSLNLSAQDYKSKYERDLHVQAFEYLEVKDYQSAQRNYDQLIELNPENWQYALEYGLAYLNAPTNKKKSIKYFERALRYSTYDTLPEIYYYLGRAFQLNHEFEKAIETYRVFESEITTKGKAAEKLRHEIDNYIKTCQHGIYHMSLNEKNPLENAEKPINDVRKYCISKDEYILVENLGSKVNSPFSDYAPVFMNNENTLVFTSRRGDVGGVGEIYIDGKFFEDIFISNIKEGDWSEPVKIDYSNQFDSEFKNDPDKHNSSVSVSLKENKLYTCTNNKILESKKANNVWMKPDFLEEGVINVKKARQISAFLHPNEQILFVVSDKKGGYGGTDIYFSELQSNGNWGPLQNLGPVINTEEDEDSPFIVPDGNTLYFSSKGHSSIGGFDIFRSKMRDGKWDTPISLGIPINTPANETHYMVSSVDNRLAYYSSSRPDGYGDMDIYKISRKADELERIEDSIPDLDLETLLQIDSIVSEIERIKGKEAANLALTQLKKQEMSLSQAAEQYIGDDIALVSPDDKPAEPTEPGDDIDDIPLPDFPIDIPGDDPIDLPDIPIEDPDAPKELPKEEPKEDPIAVPVPIPDVPKEEPKEEPIEIPVEEPKEEPKEEPIEIPVEEPKEDPVDIPVEEPKEIPTEPLEKPSDEMAAAVKDLFRDILFDFNVNQLNDENREQLRQLRDWLKENPNQLLVLEGHADDRGTNEVNMIVSKQRVLMVFDYLVKQGADPMRMSYDYKGEEEPKVENNSAENRHKNRRVELDVESTLFFTYVNFGFDSYALIQKAQDKIDDIAVYMKVNPGTKVHLSGFTDKIGNPAYNKILAEKRVKAAYNYLVDKGVDASRITYDSYGEDKPTVPDNYPNSNALNRRVEFRIK